jgi:GGDEF domain-containing protein
MTPSISIASKTSTTRWVTRSATPAFAVLRKSFRRDSDAAVYRAKRAGRNQLAVAGDEPLTASAST